ncbi:MAG: U32 family peptidase [Flavobacteriales bacterium]|nr:U32 family peptidase [Flavobacteriales bacterium]
MKTIGKIELMAPAGDFESLQAAIDAGADSVYFGVEQLNMRARATLNFTMDDLKEVVSRCSAKGVRTYLTLNTIIYDHDIPVVRTLLEKTKQAGVTAVIASDQYVISTARTIGVEVHISTQQNVSNLESLRFFSTYADTVVLARELSLKQVKSICEAIKKENITGPSGRQVEIEMFGHGALCMAISGKCYMSLHAYNSSANRGACKQNCRKAYIVTEKETGNQLEIDNEYIMSPKDLCTVDFLDKVIDAGVGVLKLEGRGRAPEYVYTVVKTYREAIDAYYAGEYSAEKAKEWVERLKTVYNRGFWSGYYLGQKMGQWSDNSGSNATQRKVYIGKGLHFFPKSSVGEILIEAFDIKKGDRLIITGPTTGVQEITAEDFMADEKNVEIATKGAHVTMKLSFRLRPSDKVYKIEATEYATPSSCSC